MHNFIVFVLACLAFFSIMISIFSESSSEENKPITGNATPKFVCTQCLTVGDKEKVVQGSTWVEIPLYAFGVILGVIYTIWRQSTIKHVCPSCKLESMIPVESPNGQLLVKQSAIQNQS